LIKFYQEVSSVRARKRDIAGGEKYTAAIVTRCDQFYWNSQKGIGSRYLDGAYKTIWFSTAVSAASAAGPAFRANLCLKS
jgi:hypothetical protein